MADVQKQIAEKLTEITECAICFKPFTDPRILPCIHTFCLECLNKTRDFAKKNPGEILPCPLCRKGFTIPKEGMAAIQKNFFIDNLVEVKKMVQLGKTSIVLCDVCRCKRKGETEKDLLEATHRCLECQESYCESCLSVHSAMKMAKSHTVVEIGNESEEELIKRFPMKTCGTHVQKPLDYYCTGCKKVICVSCFIQSHSSHVCNDVTALEKEFRQTIGTNLSQLTDIADEMNAKIKLVEQKKTDFLSSVPEIENSILKRNQELKEMIERETESLLKELSSTKEEYLKELQLEIEEIEVRCVALQNMKVYCSELVSKGSASDICGCVDEIMKRTDEISENFAESDHVLIKTAMEISFSSLDVPENLIGRIEKKNAGCPKETEFTNVLVDTTEVTRENFIYTDYQRSRTQNAENVLYPCDFADTGDAEYPTCTEIQPLEHGWRRESLLTCEVANESEHVYPHQSQTTNKKIKALKTGRKVHKRAELKKAVAQWSYDPHNFL